MIKRLLFLLPVYLFGSVAVAQQLYLDALPSGYTFHAKGGYAYENTVEVISYSTVFINREGNNYSFEEIARHSDGTLAQRSAIVVYTGYPEKDRLNARYDCAPTLTDCKGVATRTGELVEVIRSTERVGEVWVTERTYPTGGSEEYFMRDCTTYDEYGLWIDFVRIKRSGMTEWAARVSPPLDENPEIRIRDLWAICDRGLATS